MKVPVSWLKRYVDTKLSGREIADALTMVGLEVEGLERKGPPFNGVVTARVEECGKHPDADKLSLTKVTDGVETYQVVCGAPNVKAGITIAFAKVGANLPDDFKIKKSKIRGVESFGMICSARELKLGEDHDGIMHLDTSLPLNVPLEEALGLADWVLEVNVTANRPDCLSMFGIARELAAATGSPLKFPEIAIKAQSGDVNASVAVDLQAPEGCPRYGARKVTGVKVGPSPDWMRKGLEAAGIRPISNVVDITNWVMLELGHPMHAFDARAIDQGKIVIRWATEGETLMTLDGVTYTLKSSDLLIADPVKPLALAGVMGGEHTGIADSTTDVVLEAAYFDPITVRKTSKRLRLHSESSHRFERGADPEMVTRALDRAAQLLEELAGGTVVAGTVDRYPKPIEKRLVQVRFTRVNQLLGVELERHRMESLLKSIGFRINEYKESNLYYDPEIFQVEVPTNRPDVTIEADVIEEIARLYGFDKLPTTPPQPPCVPVREDQLVQTNTQLRHAMIGLGYDEAVTYSFAPAGEVVLANPMKDEEKWLRTTLAESLIRTVVYNVNHQNPIVDLFEVGRVFRLAGEGKGYHQEYHLGVVSAGTQVNHWQGATRTVDYYTAKGVVESVLSELRIDWKLEAGPGEGFAQLIYHPARSARVSVGGQIVGVFGEAHPQLLADNKLAGPVALVELDIERLMAAKSRPIKGAAVGQFPKAERDLALLVDGATTFAQLKRAVDETGGKLLEESRLFDVFTGGSIEAGKKSLAMSLSFRHPERTLTDAEVDKGIQRIVQRLEKEFGAKLR